MWGIGNHRQLQKKIKKDTMSKLKCVRDIGTLRLGTLRGSFIGQLSG